MVNCKYIPDMLIMLTLFLELHSMNWGIYCNIKLLSVKYLGAEIHKQRNMYDTELAPQQ